MNAAAMKPANPAIEIRKVRQASSLGRPLFRHRYFASCCACCGASGNVPM